MTKKWTRADPEYKRIVKTISQKYGVDEKSVERTIKVYLFQIKRLMVKGNRVQLPGIMYMSIHPKQVKAMKLSYKQRKKRYQKREHFNKYVKK